jgi:predicted DNA-binding WGR domain protein
MTTGSRKDFAVTIGTPTTGMVAVKFRHEPGFHSFVSILSMSRKGGKMPVRYFEFVGADPERKIEKSEKFWEISVEGSEVTVRFGKIGAQGQTTVKTLASEEAAEAEAAKLIAAKMKKGYAEAG